MTKREAKNRVAYALWQFLALGSCDYFHGDRDDPRDWDKIQGAVDYMADEMMRRSGSFWDKAVAANKRELERFEAANGMRDDIGELQPGHQEVDRKSQDSVGATEPSHHAVTNRSRKITRADIEALSE